MHERLQVCRICQCQGLTVLRLLISDTGDEFQEQFIHLKLYCMFLLRTKKCDLQFFWCFFFNFQTRPSRPTQQHNEEDGAQNLSVPTRNPTAPTEQRQRCVKIIYQWRILGESPSPAPQLRTNIFSISCSYFFRRFGKIACCPSRWCPILRRILDPALFTFLSGLSQTIRNWQY